MRIIVMIFLFFLAGNLEINAINFDNTEDKFRQYLIGESFSDNESMQNIVNLNDDKVLELMNEYNFNEPYLWQKFSDFNNSSVLTSNFNNVYLMSVSYKTPNSKFYNNQKLNEMINYSLEFLKAKYDINLANKGNWWDYEIGTPFLIVKILTVLNIDDFDYIKKVDQFIKDPKYRLNGVVETGANLVDKCFIVSINSVLNKNENRLNYALKSVEDVYEYVTSGDGFYKDGSFVQHNHIAYTGSYGEVILEKSAMFMHVFDFAKNHKINNIYNFIENSFYPIMYNSQVMDMTRGRAISRPDSNNQKVAQSILSSSNIIYDKVNDEKALGIIKSMITENQSTLFNTQLALKLLNDDNIIKINENRNISKNFNAMNQFVTQSTDYAAAVSGFSKKISSFETGNGENLKGFLTGAGMLYIYNDNLTAYDAKYFTLIDSNKMPGVSANESSGILKPDWSGYFNTSNIAGGVSQGKYGSFALESNLQNILQKNSTAKKSYFFSDGFIIALGSGIKSDYSVVDNRLAIDKSNVYVDGEVINNYEGEANKIFIEGYDKTNGIGYDLNSDNVKLKTYNSTGNYKEINKNYDEDISAVVNELIINHGSEMDTYDYAILPNTNLENLNEFDEYTVLNLDENSHLIKLNDGTIMGNVFSKAKTQYYNFNDPASFIITNHNEYYEVSLSALDSEQEKISFEVFNNVELYEPAEGVELINNKEFNIQLNKFNGTIKIKKGA